MTPSRRLVAYVLPVHDEEDGIRAFHEALVMATKKRPDLDFEFVYVDDGSRDGSLDLLLELRADDDRVTVISLARNFGHQIAVTAGLDAAAGRDAAIVMDTDLQDPPDVSLQLIESWESGVDVAYAQRRTRKDSSFKRGTAYAFYWVLTRLASVQIPRNVGDFRLMSRRAVDRLNAMGEQDRFLRGMVAWMGGRQAEVLYDRDPRFAGETGYTLKKMIRLATAGITSFSTLPLKLAVVLAGAGAVIAFGLLLYVFVGFITGHVARGWTSLAMMMVFFGVGQFMCLAVMGAYIGRIFLEVKARPLYFVDEVLRSPNAEPASGMREAQR
jgi:dolichol-phosphate mannosyltransferase